MTYLTDEEKKMPDDLIRLQLALGTQSCDTQGEVSELFKEYGDLRVAKFIKDILSDVEGRNPYPDDIFIEPTKEDWVWLNSICRTEPFLGSFGRLVWTNCIKEIQESIDNL